MFSESLLRILKGPVGTEGVGSQEAENLIEHPGVVFNLWCWGASTELGLGILLVEVEGSVCTHVQYLRNRV
jgi:hypothetical protein